MPLIDISEVFPETRHAWACVGPRKHSEVAVIHLEYVDGRQVKIEMNLDRLYNGLCKMRRAQTEGLTKQ